MTFKKDDEYCPKFRIRANIFTQLHTKGGVILTNPEDIFNFIAS
jgi:hypothetical protein